MSLNVRRFRWPAGLGFLLVFSLLAACGPAESQSASDTVFPITKTSNGFTVSLQSVTPTQNQTLVALRIEDARPEEEPDLRSFEGLLPVRDLELRGLDFAEGNYAGSTTAISGESDDATAPTIVAYRHEFPLAPVDEDTRDVRIIVKTLRFEAPDPSDPPIVIEGDWTFEFDIAALPTADFTRMQVGKTENVDGVSFTIDAIDLGTTETVVHYLLTSNTEGHLERTNLVAQLEDGTFKVPARVEQRGDRYTAYFEPLAAESSVKFVMPAVVVEVREPVSITFPVQTPLSGEQQIGHVDNIADESVEVVSVTNEFPKEAREDPAFLVRVENAEPGQGGRILPGMPLGEQAVRATDDLGNEYAGVRAATNLEKSDLVTMWAGGSSFTFEGTLPAGVTELTITLDSYGKLIGPFELDVVLQ